MKKFILTILIVFWASTAFTQVVDLTCKFQNSSGGESSEFYVGLDYKNSKWLREGGSGAYMWHGKDVDVILTVRRMKKNEMNLTHSLWVLSRITGDGEMAGYELTEEDSKLIADQQIINIKKNKIGDLNNKSLDPARNKLRAKTFVEYIMNKPNKKVAGVEVPPIKTKFKCEKLEKKYKF